MPLWGKKKPAIQTEWTGTLVMLNELFDYPTHNKMIEQHAGFAGWTIDNLEKMRAICRSQGLNTVECSQLALEMAKKDRAIV